MLNLFSIGNEKEDINTDRSKLHYDNATHEVMLNLASDIVTMLEDSSSQIDFDVFISFQNLKNYMVDYDKNSLTYAGYTFNINNHFLTITRG